MARHPLAICGVCGDVLCPLRGASDSMSAWLRRMAVALMTWRLLTTWYLIAVFVGGLGSFLAYRGPATSPAWQQWSGGVPWLVDTFRLALAAGLSLFVVWALGALDAENGMLRKRVLEGRWALVPPAIFVVVVAIHFHCLPQTFIAELHERSWPGTISFRTIYVPYFPYLLYTVALWCGIAMPPFLFILVRVRGDWARWKAYQRQFETAFAALAAVDSGEDHLLGAQVALQNYVARLKQIGERSLPVLLAVAAMLVYEQLTPTHKTVLTGTQNTAKVVVWLLMGPALSSLVIIVMFGYQSAIRRAERGYRRLLASPKWGTPGAREKVLKAREELMWKGNGGSFALSILTSTSVLLLLIASGSAYIVNSANAGGWPAVFIPEEVVTMLRRVFAWGPPH